MHYSQILLPATATFLVLLCFSCREPLGNQHGTTPPESSVPSNQKERIKDPAPKKEDTKRDINDPNKTKPGQKTKSKDTLTPKIAILQ